MAEKVAAGQERKKTFDFGNIVLLLIDSGAFDHVCPLAFADWLKLDADDSIKGEVVGAGGEILKHFGHRKVIFDLFGRGRLLVNFHVLDVRRPIISVSKIIQHGYMVVFGKQSYIEKDCNRFALLKVAGLYYLPVRLNVPADFAKRFCDQDQFRFVNVLMAEKEASKAKTVAAPWSLVCVVPNLKTINLHRVWRNSGWNAHHFEMRTCFPTLRRRHN
jgi:hypothetical protein